MSDKGGKRRLRPFRLSLFGDGMLERVRSTSLGLLGLAAAIGLGMVALVLDQELSPVLDSPVPERPITAVHGGVAVDVPKRLPARRDGSASPVRAPAPMTVPREEPSADPVTAPPPESPSPGEAVVVHVPAAPPPAGNRPKAPEGRPAPEETEDPVEPVSTPVAAPPPAPPESPPAPPEAVASTHPGHGNAYGKGNGNGPPGGVPPGQVGK